MSGMLRRSATLALALAIVSVSAEAQTPYGIRPPTVMPNAAATGFGGQVGILGGSSVPAINPVGVSTAVASPYSLSTVAQYNPYMNPAATLATTTPAYGLSTYPGGFGGYPFYPPIGGGVGVGAGFALQGYASVLSAAGQYEKDIQQARMGRELSRQMELDTRRRTLQYQWWYENQMLLSSSRRRDAEMALEVDNARKNASDTEIYSGHSLNVLLRSINASGKLNRGPTIPLDEDILKHVNLSGGTSPGNIGMLKDAGKVEWKLEWPDALLSDALEENRTRLTKSLRSAVENIKDNARLSTASRNNIKGDFDSLLKKLNETDNDLTPSQSIEARRFMNQLASAIKALSDPKAGNYFNNTWNAKGRNVAELVDHMNREGLKFAPAAPGDEAAYRAVYQAMRAFESGLQYSQR